MSKFDVFGGVGVPLKVFENEVYNTVPEGDVFYYKNTAIAKRMLLAVTPHSTYKTQYVNDLLKLAIRPLNEYTQIQLYDKRQNEINNLSDLPALNPEYSSIVFAVEPENPPAYISVVIYTGATGEDVILADGSRSMDSGYTPSKDKDVVTKDYLEKSINEYQAQINQLSKFTLYQGDVESPDGINYQDNKVYKIICPRYYPSGDTPDVWGQVDPFAIPTSFVNPKISLRVNGNLMYTDSVDNIIEGGSNIWTLNNISNIYITPQPETYWLLKLSFNTKALAWNMFMNKDNPTLEVRVVVEDDNGLCISTDPIHVGLDYRMKTLHKEDDLEISYIQEDIEHNKSVWLSGELFYEHSDKEYQIPLSVKISNGHLNYFRPVNVARVQLEYEDRCEDVEYIQINKHMPFEDVKQFYATFIDLKYRSGVKNILLQTLNFFGDVVDSKAFPFEVDYDDSDETNRVTPGDSNTRNPETGFGQPWDSSKELSEKDLKLRKGVYRSVNGEGGIVCLKYSPTDCYSHIEIEGDYDGELNILSEGNTKWIDGNLNYIPCTTPIKNNEPCLVNNHYYTFGKVVYKAPVYLRFFNATHVEIKSVKFD